MKTLTIKQRDDIVKQYKNTEDIKVTNFQSALERCKQQLCRNEQKKKREYIRRRFIEQRYSFGGASTPADKKVAYNYNYIGRVMRGEINPECAKKTIKFIFAMRRKYKALRFYHDFKAIGDDDD